MLRTHCQTSGWSLAAQDPFNNVVRTTIEAMAATQGGTQSLHTNALDEALALPTDFSARIARNTQLYPAEGVRHDADHRSVGRLLLRRAADLRTGDARARTHRRDRRARRHGQGDRGRRAADADRGSGGADAGADRFRPSGRRRRQPLPRRGRRRRSRRCSVDNSAVRAAQIGKLKRLRAERDNVAAQTALAALTDAARTGSGNLLALAIDAARAKATVGEISLALERAFGRYQTEAKAISGTYAPRDGRSRRWRASTRLVRTLPARTTDGHRASSSPRSARTATTAARR